MDRKGRWYTLSLLAKIPAGAHGFCQARVMFLSGGVNVRGGAIVWTPVR